MAVDIGASGILGVAFEATPGTYVAPTKFFPIMSESMHYESSNTMRRSIRGLADVIGVVPGDANVLGDIAIEALADVVPYFLHASRNTFAKSGAGPYVYTYTPAQTAQIPNLATRSLSVTVVRNVAGTPQVFGYVGCSVVKQSWSIDNGMLVVTFSLIGVDEASQANPTPTFANQVPFGAGMYSVEIPTATPVTDTDAFTLDIDDNGAPAFRMNSTKRTPTFVWMGERSVELGLTRDFQTRADYDAFKAVTAQSVTVKAQNGASAIIAMKIPASIKDTYEINLTGQGDLIRAAVKYTGTYDTGTGKAYEIIVTTTENIT